MKRKQPATEWPPKPEHMRRKRPVTEQPKKRKHSAGQQKKHKDKGKRRFLNTKPEQVRRRYQRDKQREHRILLLHSTPRIAKNLSRAKKARPCCGRHQHNCTCRSPKGMRKGPLAWLAKRFSTTALSFVQDTTDVSTFRTLMATRSVKLPLRVLLAYAHTHVVFNQEHLLQKFIDQKAFLFKPPWFDWQLLQSIVIKSKTSGQKCRSSNYYCTALQEIRVQSHLGKARDKPSDAAVRDVLACQIVGVDTMPNACCNLYDAKPSRDLWQAIMLTWLEQVQSKSSGCFSHYYLKCTLDRVLAVRKIDHGTISWWPTDCPAYLDWYQLLYPGRSLSSQEKFQVLCETYLTLNRRRHGTCSIAEALAQTCWVKKEWNGQLLVDTN